MLVQLAITVSDPKGTKGRLSEDQLDHFRQEVSGHFKLQPHGPQRSQRRLIWVDRYTRGPDDAPIKPRAYIV